MPKRHLKIVQWLSAAPNGPLKPVFACLIIDTMTPERVGSAPFHWFSGDPEMARRELVWLENSSFTAWGCAACDWIISNPGSPSDKSSPNVKEPFNQHDCDKFPHRLAHATRRSSAKTRTCQQQRA